MTSMFKTRKRAQAWQTEKDALAPKVGDVAPDFELCDVDGEHAVRLSQFRGEQSVALIFGSFT